MNMRVLTASAVSLLFPIMASAFGVQAMIDGKVVVFVDVPQSAWFATSVRDAAELGIVNGYKDIYGNMTGTFGPGNSVTVAEALKIASEGAGYSEASYALKVQSGTDHWASAYVSVGKAEGFPVIGRGGNIDRPATRAEVAALLASAFRVDMTNIPTSNRFTDVKADTDFAASIDVLSRDAVVTGDTDASGQPTGTFRPTTPINRAEVVKMVMLSRAVYGTPGTGREPDEQDGNTQAEENLVVYSESDGFSPRILRIQKGERVTFRNDSSVQLWVASDAHPTHDLLPGFDALDGILRGETFTYTFQQIGSWGYHNHLKAAHQGMIIVE